MRTLRPTRTSSSFPWPSSAAPSSPSGVRRRRSRPLSTSCPLPTQTSSYGRPLSTPKRSSPSACWERTGWFSSSTVRSLSETTGSDGRRRQPPQNEAAPLAETGHQDLPDLEGHEIPSEHADDDVGEQGPPRDSGVFA